MTIYRSGTSRCQKIKSRQLAQQRGIALILVLVLSIVVFTIAAMAYRLATQATRAGSGWNDRQRSLYYAESALVKAEKDLDAFMYLRDPSTVLSALAAKGNGYYIREQGNAPAHRPWATAPGQSSKSAVLKATFDSVETEYFVVFEGASPKAQSNGQLVGANGASISNMINPKRFSIYAWAPGKQAGTEVILSVTREYAN